MELSEIKGLGSKRIETLKSHGINTAEDLVLFFPKSYYDLDSNDTFKEDGKYKLIKATVISDIKVVRIRKNFTYSMCDCLDLNNHIFKAIWYNQTYLKNAIKVDDTLYLFGKNSNTKRNYFVVSTYKNKNKIDTENGLIPIYKTFSGVGQSVLLASIKTALEKIIIQSIFPKDIENEIFHSQYQNSIYNIHYPENEKILSLAKERIDIEKIMPVIKFNDDIKNKSSQKKSQNYTNFDEIYGEICQNLPYKLTNEQISVIEEIKNDMLSNSSMNRLIQGDVGTGKTVLALIACAVCVKNNYQAMVVAPTEILAQQHYKTMKPILEKLGLKIHFLSGSTKANERSYIYADLKFGVPCLIVGTQACLSDEIESDKFALLVIDEQHRFGVNQRTKLINKAKNMDLLMLSATPIPRSLSLVYYGGVEISKINNPPLPKRIQTNIVPQNKEDDMWKFISNKIENGSKVFVVCANIDEVDDDTYFGLSANEFYKFLTTKFPKEWIKLAHGKLDSKDEAKIIKDFSDGTCKILVSTTIIEVGVDIKDADIIVLVSPEKFGLATLHQLRGRVGRHGKEAFCFCMSRNLSEQSYERLKFFASHSSGFDIAEYDFKSRGAGSIYGTKQHGRIEDIFSYISLETYEKAKKIYEIISKKYDTSFLLDAPEYEFLSNISFN
ncbi:MAG: DEAD/DEAH box helicase [Clostridia bacterium]|nr:DEAD/DEAH box helicase [Clostridia bacterium]